MTDKSRRLGRGLEALLGPTTSVDEARANGSLQSIALSSIRANPFQPRRTFDEKALTELQQSLAKSGLLQPVIVRPANGNGFELIAGERRCRAARNLGWTQIDAVVREAEDRTLLALALVENLQRDSLSPIDEARGYQRMIDEFSISQGEIGELVGRDRSTVANALRLLKLPLSVQNMLHAGQLTTGHARALLQLEDVQSVPTVAEKMVAENLSVREAEVLTRGSKPATRRPRERKSDSNRDSQLRRIEDALRARLGTDVFISARKASGKVTVNFYSNEDLTRVLEIILGRPFDG